jgi:hypothetical protein
VAVQGDRVPVRTDGHVAVVENQPAAVQGVLDVEGDVDRVGVSADRDLPVAVRCIGAVNGLIAAGSW